LKLLVRALRTKVGKVAPPPAASTLTQMILGIFSRDVPESKARAALDRLRGLVVDYNELRVVPPIEMAQMVGALPDARLKCEDLSRALNGVFTLEHEVSLERLRDLPRKEVCEYLEKIEGLDPYSRARVRLLGLQQHAAPLDEAMWAYARKEKIVDRRCPLDEAQTFLERRISEGEALEFAGLVEKQAWVELAAAVRSREVARIASIPPDRTARNMLQMVASGRSVSGPNTGPPGTTEPAHPVEKPTKAEQRKQAERPPRAAKTVKKPKVAQTAPKPARKVVAKPKAAAKTRAAAKPARKKRAKVPARAKRKSRAGGKRNAGKAPARKVAKRATRPARKAKSA
jgi:hypothetical protein